MPDDTQYYLAFDISSGSERRRGRENAHTTGRPSAALDLARTMNVLWGRATHWVETANGTRVQCAEPATAECAA